tara:strand:- start:3066 stop:3569 length:504 start_codon:yes stop_codon:yes gene_type:complete
MRIRCEFPLSDANLSRIIVAAHLETAVQLSLLGTTHVIKCAKFHNSNMLEFFLSFDNFDLSRVNFDGSVLLLSNGCANIVNLDFGQDYMIIVAQDEKTIEMLFQRVERCLCEAKAFSTSKNRPRGRLCPFFPTFTGKLANRMLAKKWRRSMDPFEAPPPPPRRWRRR